VESALAWLTALLLFGLFFVVLSRGVGRIGPRRFWRIGIWIYIPLVLALIGYAATKGQWFSVLGYLVTGAIVLYSAYRWLRLKV
jgi:hypothetical protein